MTDPVHAQTAKAGADSDALRERARRLVENFRAANTHKAYQNDMDQFRAWCAAQRPPLDALPAQPMIVTLYLAAWLRCASPPRSAGGWTRSASRISWPASRCPPPTRPCRRSGKASAAPPPPRRRRKKATRTKVIAVAPLGTSLGDVRDRALLLMGFAGAVRRSELVAIDIVDVSEDDEGLLVTLHRSKADQEGRGETRGLPYGAIPASRPTPRPARRVDTRNTPRLHDVGDQLGTHRSTRR
jgi:integrase